MSEELKPCPFCGSSKIEVTVATIPEEALSDELESDHKSYAVVCLDCGGCGVSEDTEGAAITAWNKRPPKGSGLKPCPFCGSKDVDYMEVEEIKGTFITCFNCGSTSPVVETKEKATVFWNRRPNDEQSV